jgi:hypothetical protein
MSHHRPPADGEDGSVTKALFLTEFAPRFGTANPTGMDFRFWRTMIETGNLPHDARKQFGVGLFEACPVWSFQRDGMTATALPDGRVLFVAGRHEIFRDPDFHIYNDLIVCHADGRIEIFGYPAAVFPPTDSHTATLVGESIFLIGSRGRGYDAARLGADRSWRPPAAAQVLRLDTATYEIARVATHGEDPGWIANHDAAWLPSERAIYVADGQVIVFDKGKVKMEPIPGDSLFFPDSGLWSRAT